MTDKSEVRYVTAERFEGHEQHVEQRFAGLAETLKGLSHDLREVARQMQNRDRPQYANWLGLLTIVIVVSGMAATLANNAIHASAALAEARDRSIQIQLETFQRGSDRWSKEDALRETQQRQARESELTAAIAKVNERIDAWSQRVIDRQIENAKAIAALQADRQAIARTTPGS